jgi:hypothetical protein
MSSRCYLLLSLVGVALVSGCAGPTMAPVKGRVTCNGKPVKEAMITFNPMQRFDKDREPGKPGTGCTDADGYYALSSYQSYDGAHIGKHRVTVILDDTNPAKCPHSKELILEVVAGSNQHDIELSK